MIQKIKNSLQTIITNMDRAYAVFDADGTIWPQDVGKSFFEYQVKQRTFKNTMSDPSSEFNRVFKEQGKRAALLWLIQIQVGTPLHILNQSIKEFLKPSITIFSFQKNLIHWLISQKVNVYIVSSSLKLILEEALKEFNIPSENIIGINAEVQNGIITDKVIFPAPINVEKVQAFQAQTNNAIPCFVAGNTLYDQSLLELSSHIRLVVSSTKVGERNFESEKKLLQIAKNRQWLYIDTMPELSNLYY